MVLVYQYRVPTGNVELEFPGGGVELGEPPEMAAARELKEETGLSDGRFKARGRFYLSNGASNEQVHIFSVDIASDHLPTSSGELATVAMPPIEVARKISNGTITCAPSALAYMLVSPQLVADD